MNDPAPRYTRTLARLYADQGHYDKALEVYRHLMKQFPDRRDISEGFSDLKERIQRIQTSNEPELAPLFREWFDLLIKYKQSHPAPQKM
ncbi:MAG: hypothetical protein COX19_17880 [Desulfobacterales bacterium CG23_combo_of_CG06-09_8_20_14_all_51_8]|nr:MAG: hypothetical protein COX19_17880 [Desulfobacterales bacterium CG23_combo_of_CG06-09_8_20_14_all_51_8]